MPALSRTALALVCALIAVLAMAAPASAAVTESEITNIEDGERALYTGNGETLLVEGDTNGSSASGDMIRFVCLEGPEANDTQYPGDPAVPVDADGGFSYELPLNFLNGTCMLHAVPTSWIPAHSFSGFAGTRIVVDRHEPYRTVGGPNDELLYDFYLGWQNERAHNVYFSVSACGFCDARLTFPGAPINSEHLFYGNAALYWSDDGTGRPCARIGGHNAYGTEATDTINPAAAGRQPLSYTSSVDPITGNLTIVESQTFVRCPTDALQPGAAECPEFTSTGVRLDRRITESDGGTLVEIVDEWVNTTAVPQRLDLHYDQYFYGSPNDPSFQFPWVGPGYEVRVPGTVVAPPPTAPATIHVKGESTAPDGSLVDPQGTITFFPRPSEIRFAHRYEFFLGYDLTIPPGGKQRITQVFGIGTTRAPLAARAAAVEARLRPPAPKPPAPPTPKPAAKQKSKLKLAGGKKLRVRGNRVAIGGSIAKTATKKVRVTLKCAKTKIAKTVKPNKRGKWKTTLKLRGRCKTAKKATLTVSYPGDATLRKASVKRKVTLVRAKKKRR